MTITVHPALQKANFLDVIKSVSGGYWLGVDEHGNHVLQHENGKVVYGESWIPEAFSQPIIQPRMAILHTNAGPRKTPWRALYNYIRRIDITGEMHFQVEMDGTVANLMPTNRRADCNYRANSFYLPNKSGRFGAIAFETQDEGWPTLDQTPWTVQQIDAMVGILTVLCVCYNIACSVPTTWNDTGVGHHVLYPNDWTNVKGKTCPGKARIRQMDNIRYQLALKLADFSTKTGWICRNGR